MLFESLLAILAACYRTQSGCRAGKLEF